MKIQFNRQCAVTSTVQRKAKKSGHSNVLPTQDERLDSLYAAKEGPLLSWLISEAQQQGLQPRQLAGRLGVGYGYIAQLRLGIRRSENISDDFSAVCARFLGVPTIIVKLLSGRIKVEDFAVNDGASFECRKHGSQVKKRGTLVSTPLRVNLKKLGLEARQLPEIMRYLQRAALIHLKNGSRRSPIRVID